MVQLKGKNVEVVTKEGELTIHIKLDINLNGVALSEQQEKKKKEEDKPDWVIPEFSSTKVKFGKEEKA
jgi:hypothetical protein